MKHVKALSNEKPVKGEEVAWVQLKNIIGTLPLTGNQALWVNAQIDMKLQS